MLGSIINSIHFSRYFKRYRFFLASYTDQNFYDDLHGELNEFLIKMKFI